MAGIDLTEHYLNIGKQVSNTIMNNPAERDRRSKLMKEIVEEKKKDPDYIILLSENAKKTSARPEIIAQRTAQLQNWRIENPYEFNIRCLEPFLAAKPTDPTWFSKPEKMLFQYVVNMSEYSFSFNQVVKSDKFYWRSKRKQIDIADKNKNIYIEYDGPFHFHVYLGEAKLEETKKRDECLNQFILENNYILIRISYDQFHDSRKNPYFEEECLNQLCKILKNNKSGIYKIGKYYGKY